MFLLNLLDNWNMTEYSCIYEMGIWLAMLAILVKTNLMDKAEKKKKESRTFAEDHIENCILLLKPDNLSPLQEVGPSLITCSS